MSQLTKVLVVDDDPFMHRIIKSNLRGITDADFEVLKAMDGGEAKELYLAHQPNLVITDLVMPVMNGFDLTIFLKTSDPAPYVIAISGNDEHLEIVDALGPDQLVSKDLVMEQLPQAINQYLDAKHHE